MPQTTPAIPDNSHLKAKWAVIAVAIFIVLWWQWPGANKPAVQKPETPSVTSEMEAEKLVQDGKALASQVCQTCHVLPSPGELDKFAWSTFALREMEVWLGLDTMDWDQEPDVHYLKEAGVIPGGPLIEHIHWRAISSYYLAEAPLIAPPQPAKPAMQLSLRQFRVELPEYRYGRPMTTLVKIDEEKRKLFLFDAEASRFVQLNSRLQVEASATDPLPVTHMIPRKEGFYLTHIGSVLPSHARSGRVSFVPAPGTKDAAPKVLLEGLMRPTQTHMADLNGDGREDLLVNSFGNVLGKLSWFAGTEKGAFEEHVLLDRAGAVASAVHDFNNDGKPDIVVVMAQAHEGIFLLVNKGGGMLETQVITEKPPTWGYSGLELVDFNRDGHMDILATNGDNGDSQHTPPPLKPYHGIRLYLNDGRANFREAWFYPMYGAYKALARDYDGDGDLDIAAISFFPDYLGGFKESFVYLEQQSPLQFTASTFVESISGRWMTMDTGDLNGDGHPDIVLGAFNRAFRDVPDELGREWALRGPSFLVLWNNGASVK